MELSIKKNYVINPRTKRLVKVGSKTYKQLVKDSYLKMAYKTREKNIAYKGKNAKEVKENLIADDDIVLVAKKNKVYKHRRRMKDTERENNIISKATDLVKNHLDEFNDDMTDEEIDVKVHEIIQQLLVE